MKLSRNIVALQKGLVCPFDDGQDNKIFVATIQAHLMQWGYMLSEEAFNELSKSDEDSLKTFHDETIKYLKNISGGKYNHQPFYKNFPEEVLSKSDFELFVNAILHYWSNGTWEPSTVEFERPIKLENIKYTILNYGDKDKFNQIFTDLVSINTSLMPQDLDIIKWFVDNNDKLVFPSTIPFKENLCTLAGMGIEGLPIKTTTDVLRIAVHMSGGDISLPTVPDAKVRLSRWTTIKSDNPEREKFKFHKFNRHERRLLLSLLEQTNCDVSEMVLKSERWIRLGEILHPGEYKTKFPKSWLAFHELRNEKVKSWYSKLNTGFKTSLETGLKILAQRPGEFSRRIDWLVRTYPDNINLIFQYLDESLKNTSNKVIFEVFTHFENRMVEKSRSIMVKGSRKRTILPTLSPLPLKTVQLIQGKLNNTLANKFAQLTPLGNCMVDEDLKKIPLPTNMRSLNFSSKPKVRGQRTPLDNPSAKVIRAFVHWMDSHGNQDLDLSVTFTGKKTEILSYSTTGLKVGKSCHSGDVRHRRGACAEYIDIDIEDALSRGFKYAVIDVRNFNGGGLSLVESCFGIMEREFPESNRIWLPETLNGTQLLESTSSNTLISIVDLETKEYIMLDVDTDGTSYATGDVKNTLNVIEQYAELPKLSVYDLVMLHVGVRGKLVEPNKKVDTHFKYDDFVHSYVETGKLMGV